jgi:hypothetical protein
MLRRLSKRCQRVWQRWRARLSPPPPPSTLACFRVRSRRHLVWLTRRKRRHFFHLYQGRREVALSLWWQKDGFCVGDEGSACQRFLPHAAFGASFLARAIAQGRLYVLWDV